MKLRHFLACFSLMGLMVSCAGGEVDEASTGEASTGDDKSASIDFLFCKTIGGEQLDVCIGTSGISECGAGTEKVDECIGYKFTCTEEKDGVSSVKYYMSPGLSPSDNTVEKHCKAWGGDWKEL